MGGMTTPPLADVPIRSADDLTARWRQLLDPPEFGRRSLWLTWFGPDGRMMPLVVPVDDIPLVPDLAIFGGLREMAHMVLLQQLDGEGHLAMALCRPGGPAIREDDDAWVNALHGTLDEGRFEGTWSLHLAAGGQVSELVAAPSRVWSSLHP